MSYSHGPPFLELKMLKNENWRAEDNSNLNNLGILLLEFNRNKQKKGLEEGFWVRAAFDLSGMEWPMGSKYFIIGEENADILTNVENTERMYNLKIDENVFRPTKGGFSVLVLTFHPTQKLFAPHLWIKKSKMSKTYHLHEDLLTYVREHAHDALVYSGKNSPVECKGIAFNALLETLFTSKPKPQFVLPTEPSDTGRSMGKCGPLHETPFEHIAYTRGVPTMRGPNDCSIAQVTVDDMLADSRNYKMPNKVRETDACRADEPNASPVFRFKSAAIQQSLKRTDQYVSDFCPSKLPHNSATLDIELARQDALVKEFDEYYAANSAKYDDLFELPADIDTQIHTWQQQIKSTELSKYLSAKQIAKPEVKKWFVLNFNPDSPLDSTYSCRHCVHRRALYLSKIETDLASEHGKHIRSWKQNYEIIRIHAEHWSHLETLFEMKRRKSRMKQATLKHFKTEDQALIATNNYVSAAYAAARMTLSFTQHGDFTDFMKTRHLNMGTRCGNRYVASKMVKMIYETMLKDVTDMINRNSYPLTLICDGGSDSASHSYLTVFFQTIDEYQLVKVVYYRSITLGAHEVGAEGEFNRLIDTFDKDGILSSVKKNLVGFVSDSAGVLQGEVSGVAMRLQTYFEKHYLIRHRCLPHRLESAISQAKMQAQDTPYPNFEAIEAFFNELAFFYKAPKRRNDLRTYLLGISHREFTLARVHSIRWIDSHYVQTKKVIINHKPLVAHLMRIHKDRRFDEETRTKALAHHRILTNKNMLATLASQLDYQELLKAQSKLYQERGSTLIGQGKARKALLDRMTNLKNAGGGPWTYHLLGKSMCQGVDLEELDEPLGVKITFVEARVHSASPRACLSLEMFEHDKVVFDGTVLTGEVTLKKKRFVVGQGNFQHFSTFRDSYLTKLINEVEGYLPSSELVNAIALMDIQGWPATLGEIDHPQHIEHIVYLTKWLNMEEKYGDISRAWLLLIRRVYNEKGFLCAVRKEKVSPKDFWQSMLIKETFMDEDLQRFIQSILTIPFSAAIVEHAVFPCIGHPCITFTII